MYLSPYSLPSLEDFTSTAQESSKALAEGKMIRGFNWQLGCDDQWFAGMMVSVCTKKDTCTVYIDRCTVDRCTILYVPFVYMCIYTLYKYIYTHRHIDVYMLGWQVWIWIFIHRKILVSNVLLSGITNISIGRWFSRETWYFLTALQLRCCSNQCVPPLMKAWLGLWYMYTCIYVHQSQQSSSLKLYSKMVPIKTEYSIRDQGWFALGFCQRCQRGFFLSSA